MYRLQPVQRPETLEIRHHSCSRAILRPIKRLNACSAASGLQSRPVRCLITCRDISRQQHQQQQVYAPAFLLTHPPAVASQYSTQNQKRRLIATHAVPAVGHAATTAADSAVTTLVATLCRKVLQHVTDLLSAVVSWPWWALGFVLSAGVLLGFGLSKVFASYIGQVFDPGTTSRENAELRAKVAELQQVLAKVEPVAYKSMKLRFTKGINKAVILGMVDTMLANKEVNIWWLPDSLERMIYFNMMTLLLSVLDEVVEGMSISFAGHNVQLQLTYLDVDRGSSMSPAEATAAAAAAETDAEIQAALEPPIKFT